MIQLVMNSKLDINFASGIRRRLPKEKHLRLTSLYFVGNTERLYRRLSCIPYKMSVYVCARVSEFHREYLPTRICEHRIYIYYEGV